MHFVVFGSRIKSKRQKIKSQSGCGEILRISSYDSVMSLSRGT